MKPATKLAMLLALCAGLFVMNVGFAVNGIMKNLAHTSSPPTTVVKK